MKRLFLLKKILPSWRTIFMLWVLIGGFLAVKKAVINAKEKIDIATLARK